VIKPNVKLNLRLPENLRDVLAEEASNARRSLNSEIVFRLYESLSPRAFEKKFIASIAKGKPRKKRQ
jgi:hypothetical protein